MGVKINYTTGVTHCIPPLILYSKNEEDGKHVPLVAQGFVRGELCPRRNLYLLFKLMLQLTKLHFVESSLAKWNNNMETGKIKSLC